MRRRFTAAASVVVAAVSTVSTVSTVVTAGTATGEPEGAETFDYDFRVLGEQFIGEHARFGGTRVREISGIDYRAATDEWYLLSDESTRFQPARFYGADLSLDEAGFTGVAINSVATLRQPDGMPFPEARRNETGSVDPEAIRVDPADGSLLWASEGSRDIPGWGRPTLVDPTVRRAEASGTFVARHPTATHLAASAEERGVRDGLGLEGLTFNTSGSVAVTALEAPLLQDGTAVRLSFTSASTGSVFSQLAYEPAAVPGNGVSEILAKDASTYLVLERAALPDGRFSVRLYEISTAGARSVLPMDALAGAAYTPVQKRLLVDFAELGLARVRNVEGMAWGPTLPSGERTLVFASDNDREGRTHLVALGVTLS